MGRDRTRLERIEQLLYPNTAKVGDVLTVTSPTDPNGNGIAYKTPPVTPGGGSVKVEPFRIAAGPQSTKFGSTTKLICGSQQIDPNDAKWSLTGSSTALFYATIETTNASNVANVELLQMTGTGSPTIVASMTTAGTTATYVSASVSAAFRPGANAGIFVIRIWITTPNTNDQATITGGGLEITV